MTDLTNTERAILDELAEVGPLTVDAFVNRVPGRYVNSWAPSFTHLRQKGLLHWNGQFLPTTHGSKAHVHALTDEGRAAL